MDLTDHTHYPLVSSCIEGFTAQFFHSSVRFSNSSPNLATCVRHTMGKRAGDVGDADHTHPLSSRIIVDLHLLLIFIAMLCFSYGSHDISFSVLHVIDEARKACQMALLDLFVQSSKHSLS